MFDVLSRNHHFCFSGFYVFRRRLVFGAFPKAPFWKFFECAGMRKTPAVSPFVHRAFSDALL